MKSEKPFQLPQAQTFGKGHPRVAFFVSITHYPHCLLFSRTHAT